jgi:ribonuclease P/MRP protein subunit POP7
VLTARTPSSSAAFRLHVSPRSPFRAVTTRVRKQLDKSLRAASSAHPDKALTARLAGRGLPLSTRIQALRNKSNNKDGDEESGIGLEHAREVVVVGAGKAIEKVVNVAAFFQAQRDCMVRLRTGSLEAVDEVMQGDGEEEDAMPGAPGAEMRERMISCLEVSIRLK